MPRVSTFCPRCGEAIETEVPEEARAMGRAELTCPACRFDFIIAPAHPSAGAAAPPPAGAPPSAGPAPAPSAPTVRAPGADAAPDAGPGPIAPPRAEQASVQRPGGEPEPSFKPVAAGLMLLFAAILGFALGSVLAFTDDLVTSSVTELDGTGNFTGVVSGSDGAALSGVRVTLLGPANESIPASNAGRPNTTTDAEGVYSFRGVPTGVYLLRFEADNHSTVILEAPIYPDSFWDEFGGVFSDERVFGAVTMEEGAPDTVRQISHLDPYRAWTPRIGWFILIASTLATAGGVLALLRRGYPWAMTGAVAGLFTVGFFVGSGVALLAIILLIWGRRSFRPLRAPRMPRARMGQ